MGGGAGGCPLRSQIMSGLWVGVEKGTNGSND